MWAYGVTTVHERADLLQETLGALTLAGFDKPQIFLDEEPKLGAFGNWTLALHELYVRNPSATYYSLFQDDLLICKNTRQYIQCYYPNIPHRFSILDETKTYLNLYTTPGVLTFSNERKGFFPTQQKCRGALALVFGRAAVEFLLTSLKFIQHPRAAHNPTKGIDRIISEVLSEGGFTEQAHNPSLTLHVGQLSTIKHGKFKEADSFPGENFDAMRLLD